MVVDTAAAGAAAGVLLFRGEDGNGVKASLLLANRRQAIVVDTIVGRNFILVFVCSNYL